MQDLRYYRDDPLVKRLLGVSRLPDVATVSRTLCTMDGRSVEQSRNVNCQPVGSRLQSLRLSRITLDLDGTVTATGRLAQGSAVGFNRKNKGKRSYSHCSAPLPRPARCWMSGNVHDSNGAKAFIETCVRAIRAVLPHDIIEVRMDSAIFSDTIVGMLDTLGVEYTISVPFERFVSLKGVVGNRKR